VRKSSFELDTVGHSRETEDTCAGGEEVTRIVIGVEPDEVAVEDAEQDLLADGEDSGTKHLRSVVDKQHNAHIVLTITYR
jgi:hypothetical protein